MELMITMTQVSRAYKAVCDRLASRFGLTQAIAWPIVAISRLGDGVRPGVIAEAVGIGDEYYFSHLFKQRYGVSPGAYRREFYRSE